jgi:hypothetical protein
MSTADGMRARREALIVAADVYEDARLRALRAPARDAAELARVLGDPEIGDFQVGVSLNEPDHVVRRRLSEFFRDRARDDLLLLHLSCHGLKDEDGTLYFASSNTAVEHLEATAIPSEFVNRQMTRSRSRRIVLLLDCCFGGAFARGLVHRAGESVAIKEEFDGRGRVVLTASRAMEYAFEGDALEGEARPSIFTAAIVEGLETGAADRDRDNRVSVDELYDYVFDRVRDATPNQTPSKWTFDVQGDLYIAHSPLRVPAEPAELPPELRSAIESPFANVRAGAVEELAHLLAGSNGAFAAAARLALEQLIEDDSKRVSEAAAGALRGEEVEAPRTAAPATPRRTPPRSSEASPQPRLRIALTRAAKGKDALALAGAACLALGYFLAPARWETSSAWSLATRLETLNAYGLWLLWSPLEAFGAAMVVVSAVFASRSGRLGREAADGLLLAVGAVVAAAMFAFVWSGFELAGTAELTGLGAVAVAGAGALGALTRRAPGAGLPRHIVPTVAGAALLILAPLVIGVARWEGWTRLDPIDRWTRDSYLELPVAGGVALLAVLAATRFPRTRLHAGGVLVGIGALVSLHVIAIAIHIAWTGDSQSEPAGIRALRPGVPLGLAGGLLLVWAGVRVLRAERRAESPAHALPAT